MPICEYFWGKCTSDGQIIEHYGRQGWEEDENKQKKQCEFRFRFKQCPHCGTENDSGSSLSKCQEVLTDPDDMLKAALKLKDALIIRCGGMQFITGVITKVNGLKSLL